MTIENMIDFADHRIDFPGRKNSAASFDQDHRIGSSNCRRSTGNLGGCNLLMLCNNYRLLIDSLMRPTRPAMLDECGWKAAAE